MSSTIAFHGGLPGGPAVGFEEPFEMLAACHERVQRMLALLQRLGAHLAAQGADAQAAGAARDVMRYFDIAGPAHHEDEERHVLPWLAAHGHAALARRLHDDHVLMTACWATIRAELAAVAAGRLPPSLGEALTRWEAFAALYAGHIVAEEAEAYPPVQAAGDAAVRQAMGREMAGRRGVVLDPAQGGRGGGP